VLRRGIEGLRLKALRRDTKDQMVSVKNLKEFAELAGVSTATASRALTGSGRVSDETRKRISALAESSATSPTSPPATCARSAP
jgi:transcriptional regulator with XRE-family HTH domain